MPYVGRRILRSSIRIVRIPSTFRPIDSVVQKAIFLHIHRGLINRRHVVFVRVVLFIVLECCDGCYFASIVFVTFAMDALLAFRVMMLGSRSKQDPAVEA